MTIYSPQRHFTAIALFLLTGCAHRPDLAAPPSACAAEVTAGTRVERIAIQVFPDQHGDTATIDQCPDRRFPTDWSESPLFSRPYADLLREFGRSLATDRHPVPMIVSGRFERREEGEWSRTYLVITAIDDDVIAR